MVLVWGGGVTAVLGSPRKACTSPGTDGGLSHTFCLGHGGATSGWWGVGTVRRVLDAALRLPAARCWSRQCPRVWSPPPSPCRARPPASLLHPHPPSYPRADISMDPARPSEGPNPLGMQEPFSDGAKLLPGALQAGSHRFPPAPSATSQEIPRKRRASGAKDCFLEHLPSPRRSWDRAMTPEGASTQTPPQEPPR